MKAIAFYLSLLVFGQSLLCSENCWFVISVVRTDLLKTLAGGPSPWSSSRSSPEMLLSLGAGSGTRMLLTPAARGAGGGSL